METTTEEIKIVCPHCGQHLAIDASMLGTELECPACKQSFTAPAVLEERNNGKSMLNADKPKSFLHAAWSNVLRPAGCFVLASLWFLLRILVRFAGRCLRLLVRAVSSRSKKPLSGFDDSGDSSLHAETARAATSVWGRIRTCFDRFAVRPANWFVRCIVMPIDARWRRHENERNGAADTDRLQEPELSLGRRIAYVATAALFFFFAVCRDTEKTDSGTERNVFPRPTSSQKNEPKTPAAFRRTEMSPSGCDTPAPKPTMASLKKGRISISDYLFDADEIQRFFSKEMTTAKKESFAREQCDRGFLLARQRRLFAPIPDGTVFKVEHVYRDAVDDAEALVVKVKLVSAEHGMGEWEFKHSMAGLGDETGYDGTEWPEAPWNNQTKTNCKELAGRCFPGTSRMEFPMRMYRTMKSADQVREWNRGTFLVSEGWYSALPVSTEAGVRRIDANDYWIVPSEDDILKLAFSDASQPSTEFSVVGPRKEADRILAEMENHGAGFKHDVQRLEELLRDLGKHHPAPGKALNRLIGSVVPFGFEYHIPEIKELISSAGGNDRDAFEQSLKRAVKKLHDYNSLSASATVPDEMLLDEHLVSEFYKDGQSWSSLGNKLRQMEVFDRLWSSGRSSLLRKDYYRVLFLPFPDGISFVVRDVKTDGIRHQIKISPLVFGKPASYRTQDPWTGDSEQDEALIGYLDARYGIGNGPNSECLIDYPVSNKKVAKLDVGAIIESDGWVCEAFVKGAEITKTNRYTGQFSKEAERDIVFLHCLSPSFKARMEIEHAASEWQKNH